MPLILGGRFHRGLSGIGHDVQLTLFAGRKRAKATGPLLWTHFGISGPAALDISEHWLRSRLNKLQPILTASPVPGEDPALLDRWLIHLASGHPRMSPQNALYSRMPARLADAVLAKPRQDRAVPLAHLAKDARRKIQHALLACPLPVVDSRGYDHAEATAGGVPLKEVNLATMESRICPSLFPAGEVLDVTSRVGGFDLQWA